MSEQRQERVSAIMDALETFIRKSIEYEIASERYVDSTPSTREVDKARDELQTVLEANL